MAITPSRYSKSPMKSASAESSGIIRYPANRSICSPQQGENTQAGRTLAMKPIVRDIHSEPRATSRISSEGQRPASGAQVYRRVMPSRKAMGPMVEGRQSPARTHRDNGHCQAHTLGRQFPYTIIVQRCTNTLMAHLVRTCKQSQGRRSARERRNTLDMRERRERKRERRQRSSNVYKEATREKRAARTHGSGRRAFPEVLVGVIDAPGCWEGGQKPQEGRLPRVGVGERERT